MHRLVTAVATGLTALALSATVAPAQAAVLPSAAGTARATKTPYLEHRFAREAVRRGDQDISTSHIQHVRELQYRLHWAGVYDGPVTGYFGDLTRGGVKRYQRREELRVSGIATHGTWRHLLKDTIRGRSAVPKACDKGTGWDACYDRRRHQVTLWHDGRLHNSWLVRGGDRGMETRTGTFRVYHRDIDHVSSLYGTGMPYSQFFSGGQAFHGSTYMTDPFDGHSHGCINMYIEDAAQLWSLTAHHKLSVHVHGRWS